LQWLRVSVLEAATDDAFPEDVTLDCVIPVLCGEAVNNDGFKI
jgi:hypothetical protein